MTTSPDTQNAALLAALAALKAIMGECRRKPGQRPYDHDSYLPAHLLDAAQQAIDAIEAPIKAQAQIIEAARFPTLKAQFAKHGHTLHSTAALVPDADDGLPIGYLAERWGLARYLPTLAYAESFLAELEGGAA